MSNVIEIQSGTVSE
ncbi:hypothetical protein MP638_002283, partial [Amoeboaphelidium occidentale]